MKKILKNERGSLSLEATIVFPVFLAFMLLIINFINLAYIHVSVNHAVGQTVKQVALHSYHAKYLQSSGGNINQQVVNALMEFFGEKINEEKVKESLRVNLPQNLQELPLEITINTGPWESSSNKDIALTVQYTVNIPVPFMPVRTITLESTAVERAWVD